MNEIDTITLMMIYFIAFIGHEMKGYAPLDFLFN